MFRPPKKIKKVNQKLCEDSLINLELLTYAHTGMDRVKTYYKSFKAW